MLNSISLRQRFLLLLLILVTVALAGGLWLHPEILGNVQHRPVIVDTRANSQSNFSWQTEAAKANRKSVENWQTKANRKFVEENWQTEAANANRKFVEENWQKLKSVAAKVGGWDAAHAKKKFLAKEPKLSAERLEFRSPGGKNLPLRQLQAAAAPGLQTVHFVLAFHRSELQLRELMALLSAWHIWRPQRLFLWHRRLPDGHLWRHLLANVSASLWESTIVMAMREKPTRVYELPVGDRRRGRTLAGLEALLLFGGVLLEPDTVVVRRPDEQLLLGDSDVAMPGVAVGNGSLDVAAYAGRRNSLFLWLWHLCHQAAGDRPPSRDFATRLPLALHRAFPGLLRIQAGPAATGANRSASAGGNWRSNFVVRLHATSESPNASASASSLLRQVAGFVLLDASSLLANVSESAFVTTPLPTAPARMRHFVYAPMNTTFIMQQYGKLKVAIKPYSGRFRHKVDELMVHRLPVIDTSKWVLHSPNGSRYTVPQVQRMTRDSKFAVPNLAHYVLPFQNPQLNFHHLVCILSGMWVMRPQLLVMWYDKQPFGTHWEMLKNNLTQSGLWHSRVLMIHRPVPTRIYKQPLRVKEHQSDVIRLEAVLVFGGAYFDIDVITLRPLEPLRRFSFTIGRETNTGLCNGVFLARPNSTLLSMWHVAYQTMDDHLWVGHSVSFPARLCKMYRQLCHVEEESMDRPNWTGNEVKWIYGKERKWDWRRKNFVMHLWYRFHNEKYNMNSISSVDSMLGDMFRFVLFGDSRLGAGLNASSVSR